MLMDVVWQGTLVVPWTWLGMTATAASSVIAWETAVQTSSSPAHLVSKTSLHLTALPLLFTAADADLCSLFRGYECDENAQCVSVGGEVTDSSSYLCACSDGYIGDGNTTCLSQHMRFIVFQTLTVYLCFVGDTVVSSLSAVLATNGSSATVTCEASFFPDSPHYWIITRNGVNETVAVGKTLELDQILFDAAGDRYQCIVETQYGDISSNLVEIIGRLTYNCH